MRISDWSSDVCSSDLLQDLSGLRVVCVRVQDHGVSLLINGAELGGEALEVLGVVEKVSCGDLVELVRLTLRVCGGARSEEHTSELQSLMRISYAVFCLKKKKNI